MDWMNRGARPGQTASQPAGHNGNVSGPTASGKGGRFSGGGMRYASIALLFSVAIVLLAVIGYMVFSNNNTDTSVSKSVDSSKLQAVFLNGGQVYFGHISSINDKYLSMNDIYYLRVNQQVQPNQTSTDSSSNDVSLVKLGCELHGPQDSMVVNQSQVIFWENLKTDGQVAKAVATYTQQNPNGQKCDTSTTSTTPTTTPTTTPSTTKKP